MVHILSPRTWEAEAGESPDGGQFGVYGMTGGQPEIEGKTVSKA